MRLRRATCRTRLRPTCLHERPLSRPRAGMTAKDGIDGRSADNDRLRQLRPHARDQGRPGEGRRLRGHLPAALSGGDFPPRLQIPGIRRFGNVVLELPAHGGGRARRPISACRPSCRGFSAIPASTSAKTPASRKPEDLRGKRIGVPEYQITAVVWMRGMMQHEYGVKPSEIHWRSGGQEQAGRDERTPLKPIPGLDLQADRRTTRRWSACCATASSTRCSRRARRRRSSPASRISRGCFPNTREAEQAYYKKTGLFPIMHLDRHPQDRWSSDIRGCRPASTRRSARPRRWR